MRKTRDVESCRDRAARSACGSLPARGAPRRRSLRSSRMPTAAAGWSGRWKRSTRLPALRTARRADREHRLQARAGAPVPGRTRGRPCGRALAAAMRPSSAPIRRGSLSRRLRRSQPGDRHGAAPPRPRRPAAADAGLIYPVRGSALNTPSYRENSSGFGLSADSMKRYWELYLNGADGRHPGRFAIAGRRPGGAAAGVRADGGQRRPARRGRGLCAGARGGRRAGDAAALRRRRPRLLPLARAGGTLAPRGRGRWRSAARRPGLPFRAGIVWQRAADTVRTLVAPTPAELDAAAVSSPTARATPVIAGARNARTRTSSSRRFSRPARSRSAERSRRFPAPARGRAWSRRRRATRGWGSRGRPPSSGCGRRRRRGAARRPRLRRCGRCRSSSFSTAPTTTPPRPTRSSSRPPARGTCRPTTTRA